MHVHAASKDLWRYIDLWSESMQYWWGDPATSSSWANFALSYWYGVNKDNWPDRNNKEDKPSAALIQFCSKALLFGPEVFKPIVTKRG